MGQIIKQVYKSIQTIHSRNEQQNNFANLIFMKGLIKGDLRTKLCTVLDNLHNFMRMLVVRRIIL